MLNAICAVITSERFFILISICILQTSTEVSSEDDLLNEVKQEPVDPEAEDSQDRDMLDMDESSQSKQGCPSPVLMKEEKPDPSMKEEAMDVVDSMETAKKSERKDKKSKKDKKEKRIKKERELKEEEEDETPEPELLPLPAPILKETELKG